VTKFLEWFGPRGRQDGNSGAIIQIAREVVERRRSVQGALNEVRHPAVLDSLADEDFRILDEEIAESAAEYREYAIVLARLTHAAARAKGFDRQIVDAALRLDSLLPKEDPSRERDQLLRDAYVIAQRGGYVRGGRLTLARLGQRATEADEFDRARTILQQQLDIGDEATDSAAEVDSAIMLGDILRREGDLIAAQSYFRRASRSGTRLHHDRGVAEALVRQIELLDDGTSLETVAALQRQALDAAQRTSDLGLQSRIVLALAETLARTGQIEDVVDQLEAGVTLARQIGDLSVESRCLNALVEAGRRIGNLDAVAVYQDELMHLEDRLGNRPAAAIWAFRLGMTYLDLHKPARAAESFARAHQMATALRDGKLEQRALGGLGFAYTALGKPVDALEHFMGALELARRSNDVAHEAQWLASIGQALWKFDQTDDALRAVTEGLAVARRIDDVELQASLLALLGQIHAGNGQVPRARECYHRALDLNRKLGQTGEQIHLLSALAGLALETHQFGHATALYEQALHIAVDGGDRVTAIRLHGRLGRIAQKQRDLQGALDHYRKALEFAESIDQPGLMSQALLHLGAAQHAVADPSAVGTYRRALSYTQQLGDLRRETLIRLNLGLLLSTNGHRNEGLDHLYRASALAQELGPAGEVLLDQVEEAIEAAGGATGESASWYETQARTATVGERRAVARNNRPLSDDELYAEATLPPH
jgi:tetratricopeptide (TPR) repeat protein